MFKKVWFKTLLLLVCVSAFAPARSSTARNLGITAVALPLVYLGVQLAFGNTLNDVWMFAKEFVKKPLEMGGFGPCSPHLGDAAVACVPSKEIGRKPRRFLEVGSGTGSVTRRLVKKLAPGDTLDLVEMQPELYEMLKREFVDSAEYKEFNISAHCKMIQDFKPAEKYDSIIITVPFNSLPSFVVKEIWASVLSMLADGGTVSYVAYCQMDKLIKTKYLFNKEKTRDYEQNLAFLSDLHRLYGAGVATVYKNVMPINTFYFKFNKPAEIQFAP
jgi:phospholipid N-methyltransferase